MLYDPGAASVCGDGSDTYVRRTIVFRKDLDSLCQFSSVVSWNYIRG